MDGDSTQNTLATKILTNRQLEVLRLVCDGQSSKEIGLALGISSKTVEFHKAHIAKKIDAHSTVSVVRWAIRQGIIQP